MVVQLQIRMDLQLMILSIQFYGTIQLIILPDLTIAKMEVDIYPKVNPTLSGTLATGGWWSGVSTQTFRGSTFSIITYGDVVVQVCLYLVIVTLTIALEWN